MSVVRDIGKIVRVTAKGTRGMARGVRATASGTTRASRWVGRNVGVARQRGGVGQRRPDAAARPARHLVRRRHPGHHRPGRHHLLRRAGRRGPRPGRALPAGHDGAVRAARAGGRPGARPLPARPPVRPGRHHARPGRPGLAHRRQHLAASASIRPPSACWRCPGRTAWPAAPRCPGCCRGGSGCPRPGRGHRSTARWPVRSSPRSGRPPSGSDHSGHCGWPASSSWSAWWWRCSCRRRPTPIRPRCCRSCSRSRGGTPRRTAARSSPAAWSSPRSWAARSCGRSTASCCCSSRFRSASRTAPARCSASRSARRSSSPSSAVRSHWARSSPPRSAPD